MHDSRPLILERWQKNRHLPKICGRVSGSERRGLVRNVQFSARVAENQAHFLEECLKIIHRTRFILSNSRQSEARLKIRGRKTGTKSKQVAGIQLSPIYRGFKTLCSTR